MNTYIITGTAGGRKFTMAIYAVTEKQAREICLTRLRSCGFGTDVIIASSKVGELLMNTYIITGTAKGRNFTMPTYAETEEQAREICLTRLSSSGFGTDVIITSSKAKD